MLEALLEPFISTYIDTADGQHLEVLARQLGSADVALHPFRLIDASEGGTTKVRVVYGTVNGTAPDGMSEGDDPPYVLTVSGSSGVIYVALAISWTSSGISIDSVTIGQDATQPDDDNPDAGDDDSGSGTFYRQLGNFSISDGTLFLAQDATTSLWFELCGFVDPLWGTA